MAIYEIYNSPKQKIHYVDRKEKKQNIAFHQHWKVQNIMKR